MLYGKHLLFANTGESEEACKSTELWQRCRWHLGSVQTFSSCSSCCIFQLSSSCTGTGTQTYKEKSLYGTDWYNLNLMFASLKLNKQVGTYLDIVNILTDAFPKTSNVWNVCHPLCHTKVIGANIKLQKKIFPSGSYWLMPAAADAMSPADWAPFISCQFGSHCSCQNYRYLPPSHIMVVSRQHSFCYEHTQDYNCIVTGGPVTSASCTL